MSKRNADKQANRPNDPNQKTETNSPDATSTSTTRGPFAASPAIAGQWVDHPGAQGASAEVEHRYHSYVGNRIPWYVRLFWILFWIFVVNYTITYLFPALQREIVNPP